jgi:hypothetical protein
MNFVKFPLSALAVAVSMAVSGTAGADGVYDAGYRDGFSAGQASCPPPPSCPVDTTPFSQADLDASYSNGLSAGQASCPPPPSCPVASCPVDTTPFSQADLDAARGTNCPADMTPYSQTDLDAARGTNCPADTTPYSQAQLDQKYQDGITKGKADQLLLTPYKQDDLNYAAINAHNTWISALNGAYDACKIESNTDARHGETYITMIEQSSLRTRVHIPRLLVTDNNSIYGPPGYPPVDLCRFQPPGAPNAGSAMQPTETSLVMGNNFGFMARLDNPKPVKLTVEKTGTGTGTITSANPSNINCGNDCEHEFASLSPGKVVTLTLNAGENSTIDIDTLAAQRSLCPGATPVGGDNTPTSAKIQIAMTQDIQCKIPFVANPTTPTDVTYQLAVQVIGNGSVKGSDAAAAITSCASTSTLSACQASKSATSAPSFGLTATPSTGSTFVGWYGHCTGTSPSYPGSMKTDTACVAIFQNKPKYTVSINVTGAGKVIDKRTPEGVTCTTAAPVTCTGTYFEEETISLFGTPTATTDTTTWGGDCTANATTTSDETDTSVTVNGNKTCTVEFAAATTPPAQP